MSSHTSSHTPRSVSSNQTAKETPTQKTENQQNKKHSAGAFDIRNIIGCLLTIYGVVLVSWGLWDYSEADHIKTGNVNANLITGIGLIAVSLCFFLWAYLKPVVLTETIEDDDDSTGD